MKAARLQATYSDAGAREAEAQEGHGSRNQVCKYLTFSVRLCPLRLFNLGVQRVFDRN
jgi:hypothetical protein